MLVVDGYGLWCWWLIYFGLAFDFCGWVCGLIGVALGAGCGWVWVMVLVADWFWVGVHGDGGRWVSRFWLMVGMVCGGGG